MAFSRDEIVDLLSRLIAIDSTNPDLVPGAAGEAEIARFVAGWLEAAGIEATVEEAAPGRPNVVGLVPGTGGGRRLMLNAHLDTVGAGGMASPFAPIVDGNRLYGRGAYDMKGSLAAIMLVAAEARRRSWRGDLLLTAVADEEYASAGTEAIAARYRADAAIVTEPTELDLVVAHKGFAWYDVETRGVAAHGSLPEAGVDAIVAMGPVLLGLRALDQALRAGEAHPLLGTGSVHASLVDGGRELSTYPDRCRLQIERRTIPGEAAAVAEGQLRAILDGARRDDAAFDASLRTLLVREPFEVAPEEPIVTGLRRRAAERLSSAPGHEPRLAGAGGWMDSALLAAAGIPTVVFGPGGDGAHADAEWVDLDSVAATAEILLAVAADVCA